MVARVQKRLYYKIGEACKELGIQPYVLRYWETEFPALTPSKSRSGQRVYSEKELEIIRRIKELLYEEGYTIAGAKKKLEAEMAAGGVGEALRDDDGETPEAPEPAEAVAEAPPPPLLPLRVESRAESRAKPAAASSHTDASERERALLSGIEEALQEARRILALLGPKSS